VTTMAGGLRRRTFVVALALGGAGVVASAQDAAPPPAAAAPRRLAVGIEGLASVATQDPEYFNYSSYERSAMELVRLRVDASLRLASQAELLAEGRVDNAAGPSLSALYLRLRPFTRTPLDIQAGRIPPVFGAFSRRAYGSDNPLIGQPFLYQYLTTLRPDALPASVPDLLHMKGHGAETYYPVGAAHWDSGLPLMAGDRWDTGVQVRWAGERVKVAAAVTQGTLSNPRVRDDNSGKQVSGRVEVQPVLGLILGASAARGDYLSRDAMAALPAAARGGSRAQQAFGLDLEFSHGHWLLRGEAIASRWAIPALQQPYVPSPLRAWGTFVEVRRKLRPGLFAAARFDHVGFSRVTTPPGYGDSATTTWDAPVSRVEAGAGYSLRRNLVLKAAVQQNWRQGMGHSERIAALQTLFWY
jgi:hypothetical protein